MYEWESKYGELETKYEQEQLKWEDSGSQVKKDLVKSKEQLVDL